MNSSPEASRQPAPTFAAMSPSIADQLARRATGALFFSVFGGAWLALWLAATQQLTLATGVSLGVGLAALLLTGRWVLRRTTPLRRPPHTAAEEANARREGRRFGVINAVQWGVILVAGWGLPRLGLARYFTPVIALVTGLHFFPLAKLFRYAGHYLTGGAMVLWVLGCLLLVPSDMWQSRVALGTGIILWASAGYALGRAVWRLKQATRPIVTA